MDGSFFFLFHRRIIKTECAGDEPPVQDHSTDVIWTELDRPLIPDEVRRQGIKSKLHTYFGGLRTQEDLELFEEIATKQFELEKKFETALRYKGYTSASLLSSSTNIRDSLFYPKGGVLSLETYNPYIAEIQVDLNTSTPYKRLKRDLKAGKLFLEKPGVPFYKIPDSP